MKNILTVLAFFIAITSYAQEERSVLRGKVLYRDINVPNENVINSTSEMATITNANGEFAIKVKEGEFTLNLEQYNITVEEDFYCTIELIENQKTENVEILCATHPRIIIQIQIELKVAQFYSGALNGHFNSETRKAFYAYQKANGLPVGSFNLLTLERLNVRF